MPVERLLQGSFVQALRPGEGHRHLFTTDEKNGRERGWCVGDTLTKREPGEAKALEDRG